MAVFFVSVWLQLESRERANPPNATFNIANREKKIKRCLGIIAVIRVRPVISSKLLHHAFLNYNGSDPMPSC
jgi:hypothetical protein